MSQEYLMDYLHVQLHKSQQIIIILIKFMVPQEN